MYCFTKWKNGYYWLLKCGIVYWHRNFAMTDLGIVKFWKISASQPILCWCRWCKQLQNWLHILVFELTCLFYKYHILIKKKFLRGLVVVVECRYMSRLYCAVITGHLKVTRTSSEIMHDISRNSHNLTFFTRTHIVIVTKVSKILTGQKKCKALTFLSS